MLLIVWSSLMNLNIRLMNVNSLRAEIARSLGMHIMQAPMHAAVIAMA
jgi:hypothetical protein